ncbi:MAG: hypothetical protein AAF495_20040 [Pseudomonadota bacterium]
MTTTTGLRRMTNKIEQKPAPHFVSLNGGTFGGVSVFALRLVERAEAFGRRIARIFSR